MKRTVQCGCTRNGLMARLQKLARRIDSMATLVYDERDSWPSFDDETRVRLDEAGAMLSWLCGRMSNHATTTGATHFPELSKPAARGKRRKR